MDKEIIRVCKDYINTNQNDEFQNYVLNTIINTTYEYKLPYEYIFQKIYIHSCLKKNSILASWLKEEIYAKYFDCVQQIALRHVFNYGDFILRKELEKEKAR